MKMKMKKMVATIALVAICLSVVGLSFLAKAATVETGQTVVSDEAYSDDFYVFGENVVIDQPVEGDLIIFGGTVEVSADVDGDIFIAGGQVSVQGNVADDIRMIAGNLMLSGSVGDDLLVAAGSVSLAATSVVNGDVYGASGNFNSNGMILGNFDCVAGNIVINGEVLGDANLISESSIKISNKTKIHGNLQYRSSKTLDVPEGVVTGEIVFKELASLDFSHAEEEISQVKEDIERVSVAGAVLMKIWSFLTLVVIGALLMFVAPYSFRRTSGIILENYWKTLFYGLAFMIFVPVVSILMIFTVVGFKLSVIMLLLLAIVWIIAKLYASYFIGSLIWRTSKKTSEFWPDFWRMSLGLLILLLVELIPGIGTGAVWIVMFVALGGLILYKGGVFMELRKKKMV